MFTIKTTTPFHGAVLIGHYGMFADTDVALAAIRKIRDKGRLDPSTALAVTTVPDGVIPKPLHPAYLP